MRPRDRDALPSNVHHSRPRGELPAAIGFQYYWTESTSIISGEASLQLASPAGSKTSADFLLLDLP